MYQPSDELQDLLAQLISQAHELGTRAIYRGEPECFPRISSGLFRQLHEIDDHGFDIGLAQQRRIKLAQQYAPNLSDDDVLTRLQHLGGKTNLIDFTRDLNIALFFASHYSRDKDGRVLLMEEPCVRRGEGMLASYKLVPHGNPASMTDVQKSVWVEPEKGYIDDEHVTIIQIPSALKPEILSHLQVVYGIEASTVYNDLSGFIRDQGGLRDPEAEWHAGVRACEAGHHERTLDFFAQYEQVVEEPGLKLPYFSAISYWHTDRKDEALAAMETFRSCSPDDARAFSEEMECAYTKRQRDRKRASLQGTGHDADATATEVLPGFCIRPVGNARLPVGTSVRITHDDPGASASLPLEKDAFVLFPELAPEVGGIWQVSLTHYDYQGVDSQPVRWPVREPLVLQATDGDVPDITVEIESLQYTYEPGVVGPLVAYVARTQGDGGTTV